MAVSTSITSAGTINTAAGLHEYMKEIRFHLLAVGMAEIATASSYDASETGSASQVPFVNTGLDNQQSNWMHFAFTDSRQADEPIVVSFRTCYGPYFGSRVSAGTYVTPAASIGVRISQGISLSGEPLGATLYTNNQGDKIAGGAPGQNNISASGVNGGTFVRYAGDTLTLFLAINATTSTGGGQRGVVQLHVERSQGGNYAASPLTVGVAKISQEMFYSLGTTVHSATSLFSRAGGTAGLLSNGAATVAQVYYIGSDLSMLPMSKMFTVSEGISVGTSIVTLDFSGIEKPYLFLKENGQLSYTTGTATIYEWE